MKNIKLFYSYSHKNEDFRDELEKWLATLRQQELISEWHDRKLLAGGDLNGQIDSNLKKADVVLLLMSQDYLASQACVNEMNYALEHNKSKTIIPIILKKCAWHDTNCKDIVALPTDAKPVDSWKSSDDAWHDIYTGIKNTIEDIQKTIEIKPEFLEELQKIEFVKHGKRDTSLDDIFVFPLLEKKTDEYTEEIIEEKYFHENEYTIITGGNFSGKTTLLRWLFLHFSDEYCPIFLDGKSIHKTRNFDSYLRAEFQKEMFGDFDLWFEKTNKVAIIDNYHHAISSNIIQYLDTNFALVIIGIDNEEFMIYFRDDPLFVEYSAISLKQLSHSKQEELIRIWAQLNSEDATNIIDDLTIDKIEDKVNNIITTNRIVPRYPFYILSILQSLETFMPKEYSITSYGHCYHALITAQLVKKNINFDQIDDCFNYLKEFSFDIFKKTKSGGGYFKDDYDHFRIKYQEDFFILKPTLNRIENTDYPIISIKNNSVSFEYAYIYFFFLGMYLAENKEKNLVNELTENIHHNENSLIIIFTIHHTQSKDLIETILTHSICTFGDIKPAQLTTEQTNFMRALITELPPSIISDKNVKENRHEERKKRDLLSGKSDTSNPAHEKNTLLAEINKGMKMIDVLGQILKNRAGSFEKKHVLEILENSIDLGLRILNFFLGELQEEEFRFWLEKMLEEAEKDLKQQKNKQFSSEEKIKFIEKTIQLFGHMTTIGMLSKISESISNEKLIEATSILAKKNNTPAYSIVDFLVKLSQRGIDYVELEKLQKNLSKNKNYWAQVALSLYVQDYLNTHKIHFKERQKISRLLKIENTPPLITKHLT